MKQIREHAAAVAAQLALEELQLYALLFALPFAGKNRTHLLISRSGADAGGPLLAGDIAVGATIVGIDGWDKI